MLASIELDIHHLDELHQLTGDGQATIGQLIGVCASQCLSLWRSPPGAPGPAGPQPLLCQSQEGR